jgi:hypothetical protein
MKSLLSVAVITTVSLGGAVAGAAELPSSESISPPIAPERFSVAGSADAKDVPPCSAGEVLRRHLLSAKAISSALQPSPIRSAAAVRVWKTIQLGTVENKSALLAALEAAGCGIGNAAQDIFARPGFTLSRSKAELDLAVVSVVELGLSAEETSSLENIYSRAHELGLALAPADTGPQLRLQYFDQPIGEFLYVGTEPIKAKRGDANIFIVANGGAGLLLLGEDVRANVQFFPSSKFVFVRGTRMATMSASPHQISGLTRRPEGD